MDLEKLRHLNQELLQKLRTNQEEFKRRIQAELASPSSQLGQNTPQNRRVLDAEKGKENQTWFSKDGSDTVVPDFAEARSGPQSPSKPASSLGEKLKERTQKGNAAHAKASARMPQGPRSILLTPPCNGGKEKTKKEGGHVTFVSDPEEHTIPAGDWSIRPFLGYDWIAGLLDMDSSLSEKPEQYFHELQDFRRVNRADCIYDQDSRSDGLGSSTRDHELDQDPSSHQCVYCYRLNKRLFAEPLDPESACPVCKTPRARRPPETLVEPAFVRISIPRSTLLPAYKHKIHRRKSYEATDNLALPSHCLAGWENPVRAPSPTLGSLDLRSSLDAEPSNQADQNAASRQSQRAKTDRLLDISRSAAFKLGTLGNGAARSFPAAKQSGPGMEEAPEMEPWALLQPRGAVSSHVAPPKLAGGKRRRIHWMNWEPWVCMCDLGKQARIRHYVVQAANFSLKLEPSEFWQEKPCSARSCAQCQPEECPDGDEQEGAGSARRFEALAPPKPHDVEVPLPPRSDFPSYDSLPVDSVEDEQEA